MRSGMEMSDWLNVELRRETESSMMVGVANVRYKPTRLLGLDRALLTVWRAWRSVRSEVETTCVLLVTIGRNLLTSPPRWSHSGRQGSRNQRKVRMECMWW